MRTIIRTLAIVSSALLIACSSGPEPAAQTDTPAPPLPGSTATLAVQGLSCPLCASNVDKQLLRVAGVEKVDVDLGAGIVKVAFDPAAAPSAAALRKAVEDSGYTLTAVTTP